MIKFILLTLILSWTVSAKEVQRAPSVVESDYEPYKVINNGNGGRIIIQRRKIKAEDAPRKKSITEQKSVPEQKSVTQIHSPIKVSSQRPDKYEPKKQKTALSLPSSSSEKEQMITDLFNDTQARPYIEEVKTDLNLGSDEDLKQMISNINPKIIEKIESLDIEITPEQQEKVLQIARANRNSLVKSMLVGSYPTKTMQQIEDVIPELKKLKKEEKKAGV